MRLNEIFQKNVPYICFAFANKHGSPLGSSEKHCRSRASGALDDGIQ